uniref:non-specific serine/threonine protein kinase n=1 Tax=Graphocephala atropunctata TaxID=36148 RepID=A0A1B6M5Z0_9HEMI
MSRKIFVYDLPYSVRKSLCRILDAADKWEELGGEHMGFDYTYLQYIRRKDSPTDELLTSWGNQNHSVDDLFVLLSKMQHYRAMSLLRDLVQEQHLHLLKEGEELMNQHQANKAVDKDSVNRAYHRQNGIDAPESSQAAARPSSDVTVPQTSEDNKDLGLDLHNLNLASDGPVNKMPRKAFNEVKIQNTPNSRRNQHLDQNLNAHCAPNGQCHADHNLNNNPQPEKLGQERKLSNVSVTSSVMEGLTPLIGYEELETATNGWDTTCILGRGGFGIVYQGTWKNTLVAIKKLEAQRDQQIPSSELNSSQIQSMRELRYLNSHRHDNILSLYGYSVTENACCLVYQYMANGSLEDRLLCKKNTRALNWAQRLNIMTGTARGIQFLHSLGQKPLVHGDIKSANILLDNNFEPRLGDFGLAREGPLQQYTHVKVSRVHGTRPYLPDEFLRAKQFSVKVDTYSFGVVLFEVATGMRAYDENRKEKFLKDHIVMYTGDLCALADTQAGPDVCASSAGLLTLGRSCVVTRPKERPDMKTVLNNVDMLYTNYKGAEHAKRLVRQRSLKTPTNPMEMQIMHDELRNTYKALQGSPQPPSIPLPFLNGTTPPPFLLSPEAQRFAQANGPVQVVPVKGLLQPIIIHHPPPPTVEVYPPSGPAPVSSSQIVKPYELPAPAQLDTSDIPLVTLLGLREEPVGDGEMSTVPADSSSDFTVSLPGEESAYLPLIPDLLGITPAQS